MSQVIIFGGVVGSNVGSSSSYMNYVDRHLSNDNIVFSKGHELVKKGVNESNQKHKLDIYPSLTVKE